MTESKRKTKRKVDLVSSHADEDNDGPSLLCDDEPTGIEVPHSSTGLGTHTLPFKLKPGENLLYYEETIPYVDRNDY